MADFGFGGDDDDDDVIVPLTYQPSTTFDDWLSTSNTLGGSSSSGSDFWGSFLSGGDADQPGVIDLGNSSQYLGGDARPDTSEGSDWSWLFGGANGPLTVGDPGLSNTSGSAGLWDLFTQPGGKTDEFGRPLQQPNVIDLGNSSQYLGGEQRTPDYSDDDGLLSRLGGLGGDAIKALIGALSGGSADRPGAGKDALATLMQLGAAYAGNKGLSQARDVQRQLAEAQIAASRERLQFDKEREQGKYFSLGNVGQPMTFNRGPYG